MKKRDTWSPVLLPCHQIPQKIIDKIFQPFFTTKPAGLGLSLSYDIVKAHGGEIKVDRKNKYKADMK
ncbi:MAG: ATP-binding protein [Bacteroidota bacterium]